MTEHPHAVIVSRGYEAFIQGDIAGLTDLIAKDAVWHSPGQNPLSGDYHGLLRIMGYFAKFTALTSGQFGVEVQDVFASDRRVVVLTRDTATRKGVTMSWDGGVVYQLRDNQLIEAWAFNLDQKVVDEFWNR